MSTDVLAIIAITLGALTRALGSDLPGFKSLSKAWRAVIVTGLGAVQGIVDMAAAGSPFSVAALAVLKTTVPSLVLLVIEAVFGGGSGDGTKTVAGKTSIRPDAPAGPYSAKMVGRLLIACLCSAALLSTGCSALSQAPQWIQSAIIVEQNIAAIVSALKAASEIFIATANPSDDVKQKVAQAFQDVDLGEAAITELLNAGDSVTQDQLDAAYDHLKNAYSNLTKLLANVGAVKEAASGLLAVKRGDGSTVMAPLVLKIHVVKQ